MKNTDFVTDLAIEAAQIGGMSDISKRCELGFGIVQHYMNIKSVEQAKSIGRERGVYITFDCPLSIFDSERGIRAITGYLASAISGLLGTMRKSTPVLVIGLGNESISADALGKQVVSGIEVSGRGIESYSKQRVCALATGMLGTTGIESSKIAAAVVDKVRPCAVVIVDSLATSVVSRVGTSFQVSTAGISPGSGVGQDKERIDKSVLGVPTVAIGVPLMLSMRTAMYGLIKEYLGQIGQSVDEFRLRAAMTDKSLQNLVVAPKEIDYFVGADGAIISAALNKVFSGK